MSPMVTFSVKYKKQEVWGQKHLEGGELQRKKIPSFRKHGCGHKGYISKGIGCIHNTKYVDWQKRVSWPELWTLGENTVTQVGSMAFNCATRSVEYHQQRPIAKQN